jgi:chromosome partitioning protein
MPATIAVLSQKGGAGKTTLVRSLADVFERLGIDVLAIDADPQGNLSGQYAQRSWCRCSPEFWSQN